MILSQKTTSVKCFFNKEIILFVEVRSEEQKGKLLFKWDPQSNVVDIVLKDTVYSVKLGQDESGSGYKIIDKKQKPKKK